MCVVEHVETGRLVTSCSYPVEEGMRIRTHTSRVVEARKTIVELLLSNHPDDCLYCVRNGNCTLQDLAVEHHIVERNISGTRNHFNKDLSSPSITRDPDKCILCGRCVRVCEEVMGVSAIEYINRGSRSMIGTTFNKGLNTSSCVNCGQCIMVCPTEALSEKGHLNEITMAINDPATRVAVQYAPAITVSLAEEFGLEAGRDMNGILNAALRKIGFDYVFDTSFSADLTIMEESAELIHRVVAGGKLPLITSCCPAWIKYAEEFATDFIPNLSTCKSPQQMLGAVIKTHFANKAGIAAGEMYSVSIMPCTAKKFEAQRPEMNDSGVQDVDFVLTTRELGDMIHSAGIDFRNLEDSEMDAPMGLSSGAADIFANTGGVMEAAIRTAYELVTGRVLPMENLHVQAVAGLEGIKEASLPLTGCLPDWSFLEGVELKVAVAHGLGNARKLLEALRSGLKEYHFVEVMTCPGGCIGGGGQPRLTDDSVRIKRIQAIYREDEGKQLRTSHNNPQIAQIYNEFLGHPLGERSHHLLHTRYFASKK
jgi:iron-only hydrogenase group A